jgi:ribonucleotide reductase beta subunit family protein with ferritin-like domain
MDFDNDVPMDIAPDEYIEAFVISDFAEVQHRKSLQELAEYDDYTDGLRAKGFSEEQIEASELFTELQSEVDADGGVMYDLYEAVSDLKDAYSRLGGHENKDYAPKNIDSPVFSFIKNELSKKPEGKLLTEEGIERYAQRYLQELEEDERLQGSLERILSSFPKQVSTTKIAKEVDSVLRQQSQEEFIKDSMVKAPVYRAVSEYQDLEYDIAFAVPREIGVHVGTEGQASQIALLSAGVEPEDFAKISNKSTVDRAEYNELFANILKPDAAVTVNKGFINIKKPLVLEDPETIRAFDTFEADLIVFRPDDDTPELIDYIEDEIAEQAGKSTTEIRAGLNKLNKLERILAELKSEVADDNYQQRILNFKQDVIKAEINTEFREWLKSLGFDSIKYKNIKERSLPTEDDYSYILFEPEQFKSFAASEFNPEDKRASFAEGGIAKLLGLNEEDIEWAKGLSKKFAENEELDGRGDAARHLALGWLASKTESPNLTHFAINARETFDVQGREMDRHNNDLGFTLSSKDKKEAEKEILKLIKDKKAMYFSPEESVMRRGYEEGGYVVKEGDTLSEIALSKNISVEELAALNNIEDVNKIYVGQALNLPVTEKEKEIVSEPYVAQWKGDKLTLEEKNHITQILRLFTQSDVAVGTNYIEHYLPKFKNNEIRAMLTSFANREFVHQRSYALLNDTLGLPEEEFSAFTAVEEMKDKLEFMSDIDTSSYSGLALAVARSAINEGMSLFSAFVMLINYTRFGKMRGMGEIVQWSIRDETLHCEGMTKLFREFCAEHPRIVNDDFKAHIYGMVREAVSLEDKVIDLAYRMGEVKGLNAKEVKQYIRYIADRRLIQLGLKGNYDIKDNPLPWLEPLITTTSHDNFFETTVTEYNSNGLSGSWGW